MEKHTSILTDLLQICSLKIACSVCSKQESDISYSLKTVSHQCNGNILLGKAKDNNRNWKHISRRPEFPNPSKYAVCYYFKEGHGCIKHRNRCTFARSAEEVLVWNFQKRCRIDHTTLMRFVADRQTFIAKQKIGADDILTEFDGQFLELCEACFYSSPQRVANKQWNNTCNSGAKHPWRPILVHYLADGHNKKVYSEIRRQPDQGDFQYCSYVTRGLPCWHRPTKCRNAHSAVEMAVWKAEAVGELNRRELVLLSQKRLPTAQNSAPESNFKEEFYCKACLLTVYSKESFVKHCNSLEHSLMISTDTTTEWKHRPPPQKHIKEFQLCDRPELCDYGDNCVQAHSKEELQEWLMRYKETKETMQSVKAEGLMSYREHLLQEYRSSSNEVHIISDYVDDVTVTADRSLSVECEETGIELKWNFLIKTERSLAHVALLKEEPGAVFTLGKDITDDPCAYERGDRFASSEMSFDIPVCFKALTPGLYVQWVVFDFDMRPVLLQKLQVIVGEQKYSKPEEMAKTVRPPPQVLDRWHRGNKFIIPYLEKKEAEEELQKEYKPPHMNVEFNARAEDRSCITAENYRERMHNFLYKEELAQEEVVSRLSLQKTIDLSDKIYEESFGCKFAPAGELFATVPVFYSLTPDTPEGFVLRRVVRSALVAPSSGSSQQQVYEAEILRDANSENKMYLELSKRCCSDLNLQNDTTCQMEIQFQLNRLHFCEMHKAIDLLPEVEIVLPDLQYCCVPVHKGEFPRLNAKQQAAMSFILGDSDNKGTVAPLLIYGPFGTGKTFTLATAAKELVRQPATRVLICTHTNSSADLYVKDHFHQYVAAGHHEARPLRIKANKKGVSVGATDDTTLQYCHRSSDGHSFVFPHTSTIDKFKVVITTVTMARQFHDLKLPPGYFTHILIDEASQMLECEALMPLSLAGKGTRIVLAGDHMQMCPRLFSVMDEQRSGCTLLNRLFRCYLDHKSSPALRSRIIFNENYRSTKEIVHFVSTNFYIAKSDAIKARGKVLPHPKCHPLRFHHVRGQCCLDPATMSWFNYQEIIVVVDIVENLLNDWPAEWGNQEQRMICVLSEGCQVFLIRRELRKRKFPRVTVENLENVQGKQFRVLVMTTVHTRDSLLSSHTTCPDFFNDPRVLNTAMTRAQSQVIVVGDAAALCVFGKCQKIWKNYIKQCIIKESAQPPHLTGDYIEQEMWEISRFQKTVNFGDGVEDAELSEVENNEDEILQQLTEADANENYAPLVGDSGDSNEMENFHQQRRTCHSNAEAEGLINIVRQSPQLYKRGELVLEKFNAGYVIPFDNPVAHVRVKGKENLGSSFSGDEVVVQITTEENGEYFGKILGVTKKAESSQVFVCTLEDNHNQKPKMLEKKQKDLPETKFVRKLMVPIKNNVTKIQILVNKKFPNSIPLYKSDNGNWNIVAHRHFNEEAKRKHVFLVEVVCWKDDYMYPLGYVTDVVPIGTTLDEGMKILDAEFNVVSHPRNILVAAEACLANQVDNEKRTDFCDLLTFTVDPADSKDLDDAISVKDLESHYEIGVHIADVASIIEKDSVLDKYAKKNGTTYYRPNKKPVHMFPELVSVNACSLLPGFKRRAISLMVTAEKATDKIVHSKFVLSEVRSNKKLSYEEAEYIIENPSNDLRCQTVEGCVAVAYRFSRAQRKARLLEDWCYAKPDNERVPGRRKSHQMIEELMIMFNNFASEFLIQENWTSHCTPLRCQAKPKDKDMNEFQETYKDIIPMSTHLTFHARIREEQLNDKDFCVLASLWEELKSAANSKEFDRITDLISTDDLHPQLLPATAEFRRLLGRSYMIRANSAPEAKVGHYSLRLVSYTQASSPIRRYLDVILQRLLHAVLSCTPVQYSPQEIDMLCVQFDKNSRKANEYQKKAETLSFCINLKRQTTQKLAFVTEVKPDGESFKISFPFCSDLPSFLPVMYRDLQLEDQPLFDKNNGHMKLTWKRRVYLMDTISAQREQKQVHRSSPCISVSQTTWHKLVEAVRKEEWNSAIAIIMNTSTEHKKDRQERGNDPGSEKHYIDLTLNLKPGETLEVQMTTELKQGFWVPMVQLLNINPRFEVCLDHSHNPIVCFCKCAERAAKNAYQSVDEYIKIWRPLCEMESAAAAVDEGDSITIEDMTLSLKKEARWEGTFSIPLAYIKNWAIECNLGRCFLCIRKRNLEQACAPDQSEIKVDPKYYTWVAHGVTTKSVELVKKSCKQVDFYINHMPIENIPECVLQHNVKFTVELIPKLLPDIRKEIAINNLKSANELVQSIAVGKRIPRGARSAVEKWRIIRTKRPEGLPQLNESQVTAVMKALERNFTLIQGPPGTGKTVVGAYVVYWFHVLNSENPRTFDDAKERNKKEVILYCGPSNKSVDVIAEYLMKFAEKLRPLRVYSRQMEILEYPYPGSILQLSRKSLRQERSKPELRSITLHHRIREEENPCSRDILAFDNRIRNREELTDQEVEAYKTLLNKARLHELNKHDVILCTCTASSTPNITKSVSARQILIDECAMATEPQALIPLVSHKPEKIVLLGDHKQLRPIVKNELVRNLGMMKSLFERYSEHRECTVMLDTQYRMHEEICEFPSNESYNGQLKTVVNCPNSSLMVNSKKSSHIVFGHICAKEVSLVVSTEKGNENSKANREEQEQAVRIAWLLCRNSKVSQEKIAILSPYNAQVSELKEKLKAKKMDNITVCTITKSQGSEWPYVILSTVRSLPSDEIEKEPTRGWLSKNVGFVGDPNQINVAITRAQVGLCILGNGELLRCSPIWKKLLDHYTTKSCFTEARSITVRCGT